ncbi:M48 family metallopeptidase [Thiohalobacter sp.]|uniref:M48 family metallopeptidase n=1 Tax=Thiohalobacter sp. TaxID=2025948 RepID=UPI002624BAC4|nr:M48 family metallopeptidase [Thiohalobacter sp.]
MLTPELVTQVFLAALAAATTLQLWLSARQIRHIRTHRDAVPEAFADRITLAAHQRAADYSIARTRLGQIESLYEAALLLLWTLGGGLQWLIGFWQDFGLSDTATGVGVLVSATLIISLLDLPFSIWQTFVIEECFGFNRTRVSTFIADLLKQGLILLLLATPLTWLILWLMASSGSLWWLYVWGVWMGFTLLMIWAYPTFIAPLFNQFKPLADEALRQRIEALLARCGFTSRGIFVMDGSRRSGHGNAYFTGLGRNKRIVFFDTLLDSLEPDEVEAVLAHELGHFKRRHVQKRLVSMALMSLAGLALLGWLIEEPAFYQGLGVSEPSLYAGLMLFLLISPVFGVFLTPVMSWLSRKHEYEADAFAAQQAGATDLIRALVKLYRENASTLTPDPLYSAFHDSHPPAPLRVAHLRRLEAGG